MAPITHFSFQVTGPDLSRSVEIPLGITSIGREPGNTIQLAHSMVSRRHAQVISTGDECQITDLGSANGTLLNGEKLTAQVPVTLEAGAVIAIAEFQLIFQIVQEEEPIPPEQPGEAASAVPPSNPETRSPDGDPPQAAHPVVEPRGPLPAEAASRTPTAEWEAGKLELARSDRQPVWTDGIEIPPGLSTESLRLIHYLPGIYQTTFMSHFLAIFEAILLPIEWEIDHFDLYLDPGTAPSGFLPWLANWFAATFDPSWDEYQIRLFLKDAHAIYSRLGTRWALNRILEIYTGVAAEIGEFGKGQDPYTFTVRLHSNGREIHREVVEKIIAANKPAYTGYQLEILA